MVLVAVGEDHRLDPIGVVAQIGEVGEHQIDAGHVGIGEHDPAVEDDDASVDLDAGAVAADLAEAAEEDDANRFRQAVRLPVRRRPGSCPGRDITSRAWPSSSGAATPSGEPALAGGQARGPGRPPWPGRGFG